MTNPTPNAFQAGDDFISFNINNSPPSSPGAGPSRLPPKPATNGLNQADRDLLSTKNGHRQTNGTAKSQGKRTNGHLEDGDNNSQKKKKKKKGKGKQNEDNVKKEKGKKEKGKEKAKDKNVTRGVEGDDIRYTGPKNLKEERKAADRAAPWTDMVDWEKCTHPAEMLNAEIDAYYRYISPTKAEYEVRLFIIELITRAVLKSWPDAQIKPFGSWQTQLYLPQGDIDLVVTNKRFNEANKGKMLAELARAMRMANITDTVAIISKARVPIIKFITLEGKLNVDISVNQTNGISAGEIINQYLQVLPGSRQLILVVKAFLSQRSMNEVYTGGLGSYAVICLVISFLQIHPKLRRGEMDPEENLGTLIIEFFELYGRNFNYDDVGISIRRGGSYYAKRRKGWYRGQQPFLLSIEDPQDRDNDISGGSFGIRKVKNTLGGAYELLQARLFQRAEQISGKRSGRYQNTWDPEEMSILAGIMGIAKETRKHRANLEKLHSEGRLQTLLSIPPRADLSKYVTNFRPQETIGQKHKLGSMNIKGTSHQVNGSSADGYTSQDREGGGGERETERNGLGAVMLDDDEEEGEIVGFEDTEDEVDDHDAEKEEQDEGSDMDLEESDEEGSSSDGGEDGEVSAVEDDDSDVVEVIHDRPEKANDITHRSTGRNTMNDRYESVSHDSMSSPETPLLQLDDDEEEENDSRYSVKKPQLSKALSKSVINGTGEVDELDSSDSDNSIIALDEPPPISTAKKRRRAGSPGKSMIGKKERKSFWSSKASKEVGNDFDDDIEYIGLTGLE